MALPCKPMRCMSASIRKATRDDLRAIVDLFDMEYRETRASEARMPYKIECILTSFANAIENPKFGTLLVYELEGEIIDMLRDISE